MRRELIRRSGLRRNARNLTVHDIYVRHFPVETRFFERFDRALCVRHVQRLPTRGGASDSSKRAPHRTPANNAVECARSSGAPSVRGSK